MRHSNRGFPLRALMFVLAFGIVPGIAHAEFDTEGWGWKTPIETGDARDGFVRLLLTPEVIDKSHPTLRDLRVLDAAGEPVPHVLHFERDKEELVWKDVPLANRVYREGEYASVVLNFGSRTVKNRIRASLSGDDFRRYALLEGSPDGEQWGTVDSMWFFQIHEGDELYKTDTFDFPSNDFRYLRLTVFNMEDEPGRIGIENVKMANYRRSEATTETVTATVTRVKPGEAEGNVTVFELDLGYRNVPLESIAINPADAYFHRRFNLSGRNAATEIVRRRTETGMDDIERDVPWTTFRRGVIYRIEREGDTQEALTIDADGGSYRYLRLRIYNGDNPKLDIDTKDFHVLRRPFGTLVFEKAPDTEYTLLFGNENAGPPDYDLARAVTNLGERGLPTVKLLGADAVSVDSAPADWSDRYAWAIWIVLIAAVAFMLTLIARNMRNLTPED